MSAISLPDADLELVAPEVFGDARQRAARLTHEDLTVLGARWLRGQGYLAYRETGTIRDWASGGAEIADVIAFSTRGVSVLLECKRTRADFRRDKDKTCRKFADLGFGVLRYFLCPAGLLEPAEMPAKWGLLWGYENRVVSKKSPSPFDVAKAAAAERRLLTSLLWRLDDDVRRLAALAGSDLPSRYK